MKLTDIQPIEKWMDFENKMAQKTGLSANLFDKKGYRITEFLKWPNALCPKIKATSSGQSSICAVAHMNLSTEAMKEKKSVLSECDAGLFKLIVPIFWNDEFVGTVGACGHLLEQGSVDSFLVNKITGIQEDVIEALCNGIPVVQSKEIEELKEYIEKQVEKLVKNEFNQ